MQEEFLAGIEKKLKSHNLNPVNLGKSNWSYRAPMSPIKKIMSKCKAAIIIGLERSHSYIGYDREGSPASSEYVHKFQSTPWIHIEAGMAYQMGIPLLILKEKKLHSEGILDPLVSEFFVFEFVIENVFKSLSAELISVIESWINDIDSPGGDVM
jgi:hypothetical protein